MIKKMHISQIKTYREPYKIFFPFASLFAIWGVAVWILFGLGLVDQYPRDYHAIIMIAGFLNLFACGFLMTAIPRMTQTFGPTLFEMGAVLLPILILPLFAFSPLSFNLVLFSQFCLLMFLFIRFNKRKITLPPAFMFIGIGILGSVAGLLMIIIGRDTGSQTLIALGRLFHFQMYMMSLVIGVGSRLVVFLLGYTRSAPTDMVPKTPVLINFVFAVLFVFSYLMEITSLSGLAHPLRAIVVTLFFLLRWGIYKLPVHRTGLAWSLWTSCWMIVLGLWGSALLPHLHIAFLHIVMITGLALMTLLVSTRVILSHGGYNLEFERKKFPYFGLVSVVAITALTRFAANISAELYLSHLMYAAGLWILAVVLWLWQFGWKILFAGNDQRSC